MNGMEAVLWIRSVCLGLRKSQTKTLADLVAVAIQVGRVSLSERGRLLAEERHGAAQHGIKPTVHVECREFRGKLDLLPVKHGTERLLRDVQFRKQNPVTQHVAVCSSSAGK